MVVNYITMKNHRRVQLLVFGLSIASAGASVWFLSDNIIRFFSKHTEKVANNTLKAESFQEEADKFVNNLLTSKKTEEQLIKLFLCLERLVQLMHNLQ